MPVNAHCHRQVGAKTLSEPAMRARSGFAGASISRIAERSVSVAFHAKGPVSSSMALANSRRDAHPGAQPSPHKLCYGKAPGPQFTPLSSALQAPLATFIVQRNLAVTCHFRLEFCSLSPTPPSAVMLALLLR